MEQTLAFGDLLGPIKEEVFFSEYHRRRPLHVKGGARRLAGLMSWPTLNRLLGLSGYWTRHSLHLMIDRVPVAPDDYCREVPSPGGGVVQADPAKVQTWIDRGASVILNSIDGLTPELQALAGVLEEALGGYVQANLYCSFDGHQAFGSHFDCHDVFAVQTEGEKRWRLYEGRIVNPVSHPMVAEPDLDFHRRNRGGVMMEVLMEPGDLLYIPRGQYHDALASSDACIHISFGVVALRGLDLLRLLEKHCLAEPLFREELPAPGRAEDGNALADHLSRLSERLGALLREPELLADLVQAQRNHRGVRGGYALPRRRVSQVYRVATEKLRVLQRRQGFILTDSRRGAPLPPGMRRFMDWILTKRQFSRAEIDAEFRELSVEERSAMLDQLEAMRAIEKTEASIGPYHPEHPLAKAMQN
jgi:ribosomal protein L16 Arg81 hydroxylase